MAHIVTLKDDNDEIAYPITPVDAVFVDNNATLSEALDDKADVDLSNVYAGAVTTAKIANGAVSTSKIVDAAVTPDKIDFAAMKSATIMSTNASIGYGVQCGYKRLGNLVIAYVDNIINSNLPVAADNAALSETIPVGYRPAYDTSLNLASTAVQNRVGNISFLMKSSGEIRLNSATINDVGAKRLNGVSVWFTTDNYPS